MQGHNLEQKAFVSKYSNSKWELMFKNKVTPERLTSVIIEYCICKLSSVLKIGPKVYNLGFDLIVYQETT